MQMMSHEYKHGLHLLKWFPRWEPIDVDPPDLIRNDNTSEIGIRMELGADRMSVRMMLRGAFLQLGIGLAVNIPVAILAAHATASQLFGAKLYDPLILSVTLLVLCGAAFLAALLPARIAASLEPMRALRTE